MSNIQTGAERMPHDLSHLGFLAGQIGRLITISTTPVIAGDSFEMDAVGALRFSSFVFGFLVGRIGRFIPISLLPFILGASFGLAAVAAFVFLHCVVALLLTLL